MSQYIKILWIPLLLECLNYALGAFSYLISIALAFYIGYRLHQRLNVKIWKAALFSSLVVLADFIVFTTKLFVSNNAITQSISTSEAILGFLIYSVFLSVIAILIGASGAFTAKKVQDRQVM